MMTHQQTTRPSKQSTKANDHPHCPMCGKTKRGWRRSHEEAMCAECEKHEQANTAW